MVSAGVIPLRRLGSGLLTISKLAFRTRDSLRAKAEASMIGPQPFAETHCLARAEASASLLRSAAVLGM